MQYEFSGLGLSVLGTIPMFVATFFAVKQRATAIVQRRGRFVVSVTAATEPVHG